MVARHYGTSVILNRMTDSAAARPFAESLEANVCRVVNMLLAARGQQRRDLAGPLRVSGGQVSNRLNGKAKLTVRDLEALAKHFDLPPEVFLRDPTELIDRRRFSRGESGEPTVPRIGPYIAASTINPERTAARRGHLTAVSSPQ